MTSEFNASIDPLAIAKSAVGKSSVPINLTSGGVERMDSERKVKGLKGNVLRYEDLMRDTAEEGKFSGSEGLPRDNVEEGKVFNQRELDPRSEYPTGIEDLKSKISDRRGKEEAVRAYEAHVKRKALEAQLEVI